ncbi:MAG TPA: FAD-dependent oxidoreductase [Candidatus Saccharimonadales bacterium]|nr:FAD-dependent oxidoreductase [Candidatus Saccharimonadales bacterium]
MKQFITSKISKRLWWASGFIMAGFLTVGGVFLYQHHQAQRHYDVIVVGAGPGGVAASIQAARMGAHVILLEPTDWIGGQMTAAGVGTMDEGDDTQARKSGLYHEFTQQVSSFYSAKNKSTGTCYYFAGALCVDPQVGQSVLKTMLADESSHLQVLTNTPVTSVLKQGNVVDGVIAGGKTYHAQVVIDADEYGDVLAQAGAAYRLGNGTSDSPNQNACIQDITYAAIMKYYPNGVPTDLQFTQAPPGYTPGVQKHFAAIVANSGHDYAVDPHYPNSFPSYLAWRGLPDLSNPKDYTWKQEASITRTTLNLGNDYPIVGTLGTALVTDAETRSKSACEAKQLTLDFAYYIQHDLGQKNWSLANDEGYDTPYNQAHTCTNLQGFEAFEDQMPLEPYVREGRRLIGIETLTGQQLTKRPWTSPSQVLRYPNSIAVGYYPLDVHGCNSASELEPSLDADVNLKTPHKGAFEIPLGVLIPQSVDGLLAAEKNISASRAAEGAIREQPISMDIGQAAGALAALAAREHTQPRHIAAAQVQQALKAANAIISIPSDSTE